MLPIDIIIFALIAAFFFFKYRGVMGQPPKSDEQRTQNAEKQRPMANPYQVKPTAHDNPVISSADGPVSISVQLKELAYVDPNFSEKSFLEGARSAFEMITTAFAQGDKTTLESLLSPAVYNGFVAVINERKAKGHNVEFELEKITDADIMKIVQDADDKKHMAAITVEFRSEQSTATYDADSQIIDGDPDTIITPIDRWTFERDMRSQNPDWLLVATESVS